MKRNKVLVSGRVQGVFFRASTRQIAKELGLTGWVRNTKNGKVELEVEGEVEALSSFMVWVRQGPSTAHVEALEVDEVEVEGDTDFEIRR